MVLRVPTEPESAVKLVPCVAKVELNEPTVVFKLDTDAPWLASVVFSPATVFVKLVRLVPCPVTVVVSPVTVVLRPETVVPKPDKVVLIVLKLLARFVTELMAMGSVAYWPDPVVLPVLVVPVPSVLVCRTAASVSAVVLGGTCQVSVHDAVPSLLV